MRHILIVEDNAADVYLILRAIRTANVDEQLYCVKDGEQAIQFFDNADADNAAPYPVIVILDINLPRKNGRDVLRYMRKSRRCCDAFVIVTSSSNSPSDRDDMAKLGANFYFAKPSEYAEFMKLGKMVSEVLYAL